MNYGTLLTTQAGIDIYVPDLLTAEVGSAQSWGFRLVPHEAGVRTLTVCVTDLATQEVLVTRSGQVVFSEASDILLDSGLFPFPVGGINVALSNIDESWAGYDVLPGNAPASSFNIWPWLIAAAVLALAKRRK